MATSEKAGAEARPAIPAEDLERLKKAKIFGVGFSKTGTTSLEAAFLQLGLEVCRGDYRLKHNDYHLALYVGKQFEELRRMTSYWDAFFDGPWGGGDLYRQLVEWYPEAYFVHSVRDPEKWVDSLITMVRRFQDADDEDPLVGYHRHGCHGSTLFFEKVYGISSIDAPDTREILLSYYRKRNEETEKFFAERDHRYLQVDVTAGDGWEKLAPFLGIPAEGLEFPHSNSRAIGKPVGEAAMVKAGVETPEARAKRKQARKAARKQARREARKEEEEQRAAKSWKRRIRRLLK